MKEIINPEKLVSVPFSKTDCGVDFYINTATNKDIGSVLTEYRRFKTDFFSFYFFRKANGYLLLNFRKIELHDGMVLLLSPHQQQEWHVDEPAWTTPSSSSEKTSCVHSSPTNSSSIACCIIIRPIRHLTYMPRPRNWQSICACSGR